MILSADEIKRYKDAGLIFPQRVMTTDDAANYLAELEAYETNSGGPINGNGVTSHTLYFPGLTNSCATQQSSNWSGLFWGMI